MTAPLLFVGTVRQGVEGDARLACGAPLTRHMASRNENDYKSSANLRHGLLPRAENLLASAPATFQVRRLRRKQGVLALPVADLPDGLTTVPSGGKSG